MHLVYLDESGDQGQFYVYTALAIREDNWRAALNRIKALRKQLKDDWGLPMNHELHAWKFLSGKNDLGPKLIGKAARHKMFKQVLKEIAGIRSFGLFNSVNKNEQYAYERLINRLEATMRAKDSRALLICDDGQEAEMTKRIRKMNVINYIPSNRGVWPDGRDAKNIKLDRIIEDPIFKDSAQSYFIQLVDFCAYALLRRERPLASREEFGMSKMFKELEPICFKGASRKDPLGVIR